jgi:hypothetical protein
MKLYRDENGHWSGTQADAKKELSNWYSFEVPTDKSGLLNFLNGNRVGNLESTVLTETPVVKISPVDDLNLKAAFDNAGLVRGYLKRVFDKYHIHSEEKETCDGVKL